VFVQKVIIGALGLLSMSGINSYAASPLVKIGTFDRLSDIGSPAIAGTATYQEPGQSYGLSGSGANIWFGKDSFSLLWKEMSGDYILQTQLRFLGKGQELHRKAGLMIRSSLASDSPMVACTVHGDGLTSLQYRSRKGEDIKEIKFSITGPDILQLEKKGIAYTMSVAHWGQTYQVQTLDHVDLEGDLLAGLFICSHNDAYSEEAEFWNTRIFNTAPDSLVPYRDYLGSLLEVMDIETGRRRVLGSSPGSWQAPNWTPDGQTLIYNAHGHLYKFNIATRISSVLNTDFANRNNNDHVLSRDGRHIAISHHDPESGGQSIIYTVPVSGGVPKRVTAKGPSYLHGWSPDSKDLIYTAQRNGDYDIYKIPAAGGDEIQLTQSKGLDDGSEYAPDGKTIYFCSARTGTMQIWKMDAHGHQQTQLTFDALHDWFPHVSPDNQWLVFISFPQDVPADQHPFYERVYLRLMPIQGGDVKVIAYLYGGQGTVNVPSWSPDSKKIAFVSNGIFD
jgi:TolB protein